MTWFSPTMYCAMEVFLFFPKYLCRQHADVKALHGCPQSYSAPIFDKKYFPISVWQWIQGCIATHLLKGLISSGAVLCCNARNTSTSLPLCSTDGNWALLWRGLCRGIQGDVSEGLATAGSSHMTTAVVFDFQDKCCIMSLIKLNFNNEWIRLIIIMLVRLCNSLGINISSVLKTQQR